MKHSGWLMCDDLVSLQKLGLTNYVGSISGEKIAELNRAIKMALDFV